MLCILGVDLKARGSLGGIVCKHFTSKSHSFNIEEPGDNVVRRVFSLVNFDYGIGFPRPQKYSSQSRLR